MADSEVNVKLSVESSAFEAGLESARDGLQDLGAEAKGAGAEAAKAGDGVEDLGDELKVTGDKAGKAGDGVEDFGDDAKGAGDKADKAGDKLKGLGDDAKGAGDKAKDAGDKLKGLGDDAKGANGARLSVKNLAGELGLMVTPAQAAAVAIGAVGTAIVSCIKQAAAFEVALDNVNTVLDLNEQGIRKYGQSVTNLVRDLKMGITSTEGLAGAYEVASAGFTDAADSQEVLRAALVAAKGGLTDSRTAVDGITSVLNAYKLSASEATRVSDLMFQAVMDGKTTFPELANGIGEVISTAATAKVSLEQLFAAIAHMTVQGIKTPQAMTALNSAIMQMLAPSDAAKKALEEVGLSAENLSKTLKTQGIAEAFGDIFRATGGDEGKLRAILGDITAVKAALALAGDNAAAFEEKIRRMGDSSGAALKAAKIGSDNLATSWSDAKAAVSELGNAVGAFAQKPLKEFMDGARDAIDWTRGLVEEISPYRDILIDIARLSGGDAPQKFLVNPSESAWKIVGERITEAAGAQQKFFAEHRAGLDLVGKSQSELVDMGATGEQFSAVIGRLKKEADLARDAGQERLQAEKAREAERLQGLWASVTKETAARALAAGEQKILAQAAKEDEVSAEKQKSDRVMAMHAELQRKLRVGVYETVSEELAARDRVLQAMVDAGLGQNAEATKLKEERVRLARAAADEETSQAASALTRRVQFGKAAADEEIAELERILAAHRGSATQRQQIEDQLLAAQQKRDVQREADARKALASKLQAIDMERARASSTRNLSTQEEIAFQQRVVALHKQGTSERAQAEIALYNLKARLRQEEESALQRLRALEAELVNARTDEIDDQIADLQDKMAKEQEAGRSTAATHQAIVELLRQKLAIQLQMIEASTRERMEAEKDPRVKAKLAEVAEKKKANARRDSEREIRRADEAQKKRAQDLVKANQDVAGSIRDVGKAAQATKPQVDDAYSTMSTIEWNQAPQASDELDRTSSAQSGQQSASPMTDEERYETPRQARERRERVAREREEALRSQGEAAEQRTKDRESRVAEDASERKRSWEESWRPPGATPAQAEQPLNTMTRDQGDQLVALLTQIATNTKTQGGSGGGSLASRLGEASYFSAG